MFGLFYLWLIVETSLIWLWWVLCWLVTCVGCCFVCACGLDFWLVWDWLVASAVAIFELLLLRDVWFGFFCWCLLICCWVVYWLVDLVRWVVVCLCLLFYWLLLLICCLLGVCWVLFILLIWVVGSAGELLLFASFVRLTVFILDVGMFNWHCGDC